MLHNFMVVSLFAIAIKCWWLLQINNTIYKNILLISIIKNRNGDEIIMEKPAYVFTNIAVTKEVMEQIVKLKIYRRETYSDVLSRVFKFYNENQPEKGVVNGD